jgi:hypothetical protein
MHLWAFLYLAVSVVPNLGNVLEISQRKCPIGVRLVPIQFEV